MITIRAGSAPNDKTFTVHHAILAAKCPDLDRMFNNILAKGSSGALEFPEESIVTIQLFLGWLYGGNFDCSEFGSSPHAITFNSVDLYVFAHKYNIIPLVDRVMVNLVAYHGEKNIFFGLKGIAHAYARCPPSSAMRIYIKTSLTYIITEGVMDECLRDGGMADELALNRDLCIGVLELVRNQWRNLDDPRHPDPPCEYHHHSYQMGGGPCPYVDRAEDATLYQKDEKAFQNQVGKNLWPVEDNEDEDGMSED